MKISLITVVYNGETFLQDCFDSVKAQTYPDLEYLVIDGASTDSTINIIQENSKHINYFVSEKDKGLYDAINKGIEQATGDVVGILNADDKLASSEILSAVAKAFIENPGIDGIYGDLNYVHPHTNQIIRKWRSKQASQQHIKEGWMPAHPTLYLKKELFKNYGNYALDLRTTADYDLILRYFYQHKIKALHLPLLMVSMRTGGLSNRSIQNRIAAFIDDYKALKRNKVPNPLLVVLKKKFSKLSQL
ncbi:hypothetical protein ASE74_12225 [Pedobacter sp. Leaf216]|uniref:glycosyltransferase family 2 protein n=1 Tax=Pedobacter sp. Leaf216 TaxID=1735684 RepID=UPI0006FC6195|nr:glycosyltransferase family 2 protein [Pedobacter sp. Leaf216]KQM63929.1 hypothetical protein ASE74_12225 [Pedobacter sp. Leaf216]